MCDKSSIDCSFEIAFVSLTGPYRHKSWAVYNIPCPKLKQVQVVFCFKSLSTF